MVTIGSCFSDDIGSRLADNKFIVSVNRLGTVYNPISIHRQLMHSIQNTGPRPNGFLERDGTTFHLDFHSRWHGKTKDELSQDLIQEINSIHGIIRKAHGLVITYGTSWVYESKSTNDIVANCHKAPQGNFNKFLLTQKRIIESFEKLHEELKKINHDIGIILTVSPVRHIKDTLELNSVSKSILRLTCHTLSEKFPDVEYFPAYEIMMDDLRDYRFYKSDLIHPTDLAIDYIWEKFGEAYFDSGTMKFIHEWKKIKLALAHKPFQVDSPAHQQFLKDTLIKLNQLNDKMDVKEEINFILNQIQRSS